jgi:hypothetical protein
MTDEKIPAAYLTDYWTLEDNLRFSDFRPALRHIVMEARRLSHWGSSGLGGAAKPALCRC